LQVLGGQSDCLFEWVDVVAVVVELKIIAGSSDFRRMHAAARKEKIYKNNNNRETEIPNG